MTKTIDARRDAAKKANETVQKMQRYLRGLKERSHELVIDPVEDGNRFNHAITHAEEVLQTLSVHLHYLSLPEYRKA